MAQNAQVLIASIPDGALTPDNFALTSGDAPSCGEGQVLCRTLAITIGAGQRAGLQGSASYAGAPRAGVVMGGTGVAEVVESQANGFARGDLVVGPTGWQSLSVHKPSALHKVPAGADPALHLGVLGTNGLTAYFGLLDVGAPRPGETVVVSAAAGSVGRKRAVALLGRMVRIDHDGCAAAQRGDVVAQAVVQVAHVVEIVLHGRARMRVDFFLVISQELVGHVRGQRDDEVAGWSRGHA